MEQVDQHALSTVSKHLKCDCDLLLYIQVPFFRSGDIVFCEAQALNGLRLWRSNFSRVTVLALLKAGEPPQGYKEFPNNDPDFDKILFEFLPEAYRPDKFVRHYRSVRNRLRRQIDQHDFLVFAIGGLFGDWGAVAAVQAHKRGRAFGVWTDRVESQVVSDSVRYLRGRQKLRAALTHRAMAELEKYVIEKSSLGLFHGKSTYEAFEQHCVSPHIVHNVHLSADNRVKPDALRKKVQEVHKGELRITYAGRVDGMKGPDDWLQTLRDLHGKGIDFSASWFGSGAQLAQMREMTASYGLSEKVSWPGLLHDHQQVLGELQRAHILLFCHKTEESPRILLEALMSGTPIIGYRSSFADDLVSEGGGKVVERGNVSDLSDVVAGLATNRKQLSELVGQAAKAGERFDDESVFRHRSELIKRHLPHNCGRNSDHNQ